MGVLSASICLHTHTIMQWYQIGICNNIQRGTPKSCPVSLCSDYICFFVLFFFCIKIKYIYTAYYGHFADVYFFCFCFFLLSHIIFSSGFRLFLLFSVLRLFILCPFFVQIQLYGLKRTWHKHVKHMQKLLAIQAQFFTHYSELHNSSTHYIFNISAKEWSRS